MNQDSIAYKVLEKVGSTTELRDRLLISDFNIQNETEYHVSIIYNNIGKIMRVGDRVDDDVWGSDPITLLAEQPKNQPKYWRRSSRE